MKGSMISWHMGKQGLTDNLLGSLEKTFKNHDLVKIVVLKSACRDRQELRNIANKICSSLKEKQGKDFTAKIVGFTLYIKKWRKLKK